MVRRRHTLRLCVRSYLLPNRRCNFIVKLRFVFQNFLPVFHIIDFLRYRVYCRRHLTQRADFSYRSNGDELLIILINYSVLVSSGRCFYIAAFVYDLLYIFIRQLLGWRRFACIISLPLFHPICLRSKFVSHLLHVGSRISDMMRTMGNVDFWIENCCSHYFSFSLFAFSLHGRRGGRCE